MKIKTIILSMLAISALIGCKKETDTIVEQEAYTKVSMTFPTTRQTAEAGTASESAIRNVTIVMFDRTGVMEVVQKFSAFTVSGTAQVIDGHIESTSGRKDVFAFVNVGTAVETQADIAAGIGTLTLADFREIVLDYTTTYAADGHVMIGYKNHVINTTDLAAAQAAPMEIMVTRIDAKFTLTLNSAGLSTSLPGAFSYPSTYDATASPVFTMVQTTKKFFIGKDMLVNNTGDGVTDATQIPTSPGGALLDNQVDVSGLDGTADHLVAIAAPTTWTQVPTDDTHGMNSAIQTAYAPVNVNEDPTTGNVTFALIKMQYTPAVTEIFTETDGTAITNPGTVATGDTFYGAYTGSSWVLFTTIEGATANQATYALTGRDGVTISQGFTFTDGQCYYRLEIENPNVGDAISRKYTTLSSHYYQMDVERIASLGFPTVDFFANLHVPAFTTPLEEDGFLVAKISIAPWTVTVIGGVLG